VTELERLKKDSAQHEEDLALVLKAYFRLKEERAKLKNRILVLAREVRRLTIKLARRT